MKKSAITAHLIGGLFTVISNGFATENSSGSFFNVFAIGPNLQITKTLPIPYPSAGVSMPTTGFSLTSPGVDCTMAANGQCVFSLNDATTKQVGITGPAGNFKVELCQNGPGELHCQTPSVTGNRFLYVANFNTNPGSVTECDLDTSTQQINNATTCTVVVPAVPGATLNSPQGVTVNPSGSFFYYADSDNQVPQQGNIVYCPINSSTGRQLNTACQSVTQQNIENPIGITFNAAGTYAYIVEEGVGDGVRKCSVNQSTGALSSCNLTTDYNWTGFQAYAMAFNPRGTLAYITEIGGQNIVKCFVTTSTGELTGCVNAQGTQNILQPTGIAINSTGTFAFIASQTDNPDLYSCPIDTSTGDLGNCTTYNIADGAAGLYGLALASTDNMLYITSYDTNLLYECRVNSSTGVVSTPCLPVNLNNTPFGVAVR